MLTSEFFTAILPGTGPYHLVLATGTSKKFITRSYDSIEALSEAAARFDASGKYVVYHCCAAGEPAEGALRPTAAAADWKAKAFWLDIDCGQEKAEKKQGYATKQEAVHALNTFCKDKQFPPPLVVDSGGGLHCYWPLDKHMGAQQWRPLAMAFKKATVDYGLLADPVCTADPARILRPVGTTNRKKEPHRVVKAMTPAPVYTREQMLEAIKRLCTAPLPEPAKPVDDLNDDLTSHLLPDIPRYGNAIADKCAQVAFVRDSQGDGSYEHWRGVIGVLKYCADGEDLAAKWTAKRLELNHAAADWKHKYDTWSTPPTSCAHFDTNNPNVCSSCPHFGKIKSPIRLGVVETEQKESTVTAVADGKQVQVVVPPFPKGYSFTSGVMVRYLPDKDGTLQPHPFCRSLFYPMYRVRREDTYGLGIRMHLPNGRVREFEIDTGLLASPTKMMEELGHKGEIVQTNNKDAAAHMTAYLRDSLEKLKNEAEEMSTMTSYGWKEDMTSFLIGDRLYHRDGDMRKVLVSGYAAEHLDHFPPPKGTVEGYAAALNHIYNRPGYEPMQYVVCSGFGSVLSVFGENLYHGLLVAVTSGKSGKGKTTACHAAMYGFGNAEKMTIATKTGATINALFAQMGAYGSLPMCFDEFTNVNPEELSDLTYRISNGLDKKRLMTTGRGGVKQAVQADWCLSPYVTANMDLHAVLAGHAANSQAEAVRMVQIKVDEYALHSFEAGEADSSLTQLRMNQGAAGDIFLQYVVAHQDEVFELFRDCNAEIAKYIAGSEYRYFRNHAACTLVAAKLMVKLGIASFDFDKLFAYSIGLMQRMHVDVQETNMISEEDAFSMMVNELTPRILHTEEYRDGRDARGPEYGKRGTAQAFAGRHIKGTGSKEPLAGRLYLVKKDMKEWCMKHRVDPNSIIGYARDNGFLISEAERFNLTKGTEYAAIQITCAVFDMNKHAGAVGPKLVLHTLPTGTAPAQEKQV